jgi:signal transduction histidine kinase
MGFERHGRSIPNLFAALLLLVVAGCTRMPIEERFFGFHNGEAEIAFAPGRLPPTEGWSVIRSEDIKTSMDKMALDAGVDPPVVWLRTRFDLPADALANENGYGVYFDFYRERILVRLNGVEIGRSFVDDDDPAYGWNRPFAAELPPDLLKETGNEFVWRLDSRGNGFIGSSKPEFGTWTVVDNVRGLRMMQRVYGPMLVTAIIVTIGIFTFLIWLARRSEWSYFWLAVLSAAWTFRNIHYFAERPPFVWHELFWSMTVLAMPVLMFAIYAFAATFLGVRQRWFYWTLGGMIIALMAIRLFDLVAGGFLSDSLTYIAAIPIGVAALGVLVSAFLRDRSLESAVMLAAVTISSAMSIHDLFYMLGLHTDLGIFIQPYGGLIVYSAFTFALGRRFVRTLGAVERLNTELEGRVASARVELAARSREVRTLEVQRAVGDERSRLMREIHDGIGSQLMTAVATAERRGDAPDSIETLRRCITDLKLTVDSLEPIEGDLLALLGSVRYRLGPSLEEAGVKLVWNVGEVPLLNWLEPPHAVHVLRILQEAFTNVIAHSHATEAVVSTAAARIGDADGVSVSIIDNGNDLAGDKAQGQTGLAPDAASSAGHMGRGLRNMDARARALGGRLEAGPCSSGKGWRVALWLPVQAVAT